MLLLGNRDLNKLRLFSELALNQLGIAIPGPIHLYGGVNKDQVPKPGHGPVERLKYIHQHTYGSEPGWGGEFELRRGELRYLRSIG